MIMNWDDVINLEPELDVLHKEAQKIPVSMNLVRMRFGIVSSSPSS